MKYLLGFWAPEMNVEIIRISCLLALLVVELVDAQSCHTHSNGCSDPFNMAFKRRFKPACDKHDVCYSCGSGRGVSRARCDQIFYNNMTQYCSGQRRSQRQACYANAHTYYFGVSAFGRRRYLNRPKSWCSQSWVAKCI
ncbi:hypothetical protein SNE40_022356 [Patella caerulea]|uniref:Uncharacterized protein n=1 Tax=Patella caerulea TaxID=87958 RepID=A0AAN8G0G6_PATCE